MKTNSVRMLVAIVMASILSALGVPAQQRGGVVGQGRNLGRREPRLEPSRDNQAVITFTLEPAVIYPGDRVTLRWTVRDRRPNVAWGDPVHIRGSFRIAPAVPDAVPSSGSHSFVAGAAPERGTFTLGTGGALYYAEKTVDYRVEQTPSITRVTVEDSPGHFSSASQGSTGQRLRIIGSDFGENIAQSQAQLISGRQTLSLTVESWSDERLVVRVPNNAPAGDAIIRVTKGGGRLVSNQVRFTVVRSFTIDNATLQLVAATLGLSQTQIHLNHGDNASSITFSQAMGAAGASSRSFTIPNIERRVPAGAKIAAHILLPFGGFPEKARYYVNNVDSNRVSAAISGGQVVLTIGFESSGSEIKGELKYCQAAVLGQCITDSWVDGLAPDVQVNNASVVVRFTPVVTNGSLAFASASAAFSANFQIGGDWEDWLVNLVTGYRAQVRPAVSQAITASVNRAVVRNAIGGALMSQLRGQGVNQVISVSASGGSITIRYQ